MSKRVNISRRIRNLFGGTGDGFATIIVRGGSISFALSTIGLTLGFVSHVLLSRLLGLTDYGIYSIAFGWCMILSVPALAGMDYTVLRFASVYVDNAQHAQLRQLVRFVATILSGSTAIVAVFLGGMAWLAPEAIGATSFADVVWMVLIVGATASFAAFSAFFRAAKRIFFSQFYQNIVRTVLLVTALGVILWSGVRLGAKGALMVTALTSCFALVLLLVHYVTVLDRSGEPQEGGGGKREWLLIGGIAVMLSLLQQTATQSGTILLGVLATQEDAGLYAAAARISAFVIFPLTALSAITTPMISAAHAKADFRALGRIAVVNARLATFGAVSVGLILATGGPKILALFGPSFPEAYPALLLLLVAGAFNAATGPVGFLLLMTNRQLDALSIRFAALLFQLLLSVWLIPIYGVLGAALSTASGTVLGNALLALRVRNALGIDGTILGVAPRLASTVDPHT